MHSFEQVWWISCSRFEHCAMHSPIRSPKFDPIGAIGLRAMDGGGLAEFERELIRARTGEGRKRAKERGVRFGRPRKMTPHQRQEALQRLMAGETQADVARTYNVDATTIGRLAAASPFEHGAVGL
jgi:hypothetical protein